MNAKRSNLGEPAKTLTPTCGSERDYTALKALFEENSYPPPHPLACRRYSDDSAKASIRSAQDVIVPVVVRKQTGEIVDGVERARRLMEKAVRWKDVPKRIIDLRTEDDVAECIAKCNLDRRQLNQSQRAILAVRLGLATARQGARTDLGKSCRKLSGVSDKYLQHARYVDEHGASELTSAVMNNEINVAHAATVAEHLSKERQSEVYQATRNGKQSFKTAVGNAVLGEQAERLTEKCLSLPNLSAPVMLIDQPYMEDRQSPFHSRINGFHYPVMPDDEVAAILRKVLAPDAWVFMWSPPNKRDNAKVVLEATNCTIADEIVWSKTIKSKKITFGQGRVVHHTHELLLVCRHGNPPLPPTDSVPCSVIEADFEGHSKKPDVFRDLIIRMTPQLEPRIELFARGKPYPGFVAWGNQVTQPDATPTTKPQEASSVSQLRRKAA